MRLGVRKGERGSPGSAEHLPTLDAEVLAKLLDIGDQVPGRVRFQRSVRSTLSAAALIEIDDSIFSRVKEAPLLRVRPAAGTAVQKDDGLARGIPAFLIVEVVYRRDPETTGVVRLDWRVEPGERIFHGHRGQYSLSPGWAARLCDTFCLRTAGRRGELPARDLQERPGRRIVEFR